MGTDLQWLVTNSTASGNGTGGAPPEDVTYSATLPDNRTRIEQTYAHRQTTQAYEFAGVNFTVDPGSLKWSISVMATPGEKGGNNSSSSQGVRLAFLLLPDSVANGSSALAPTDQQVLEFHDQPQKNMTTYLAPLGTSSGPSEQLVVIEVQVLDLALADGLALPINHSISSVTLPDSNTTAYELTLAFPPFDRTLEYDPSIGLGTLVQGGSGGSGSSNLGVIIGVSVAVPVALLGVLLVVAVAILIGWRRKGRINTSKMVSFGDDDL